VPYVDTSRSVIADPPILDLLVAVHERHLVSGLVAVEELLVDVDLGHVRASVGFISRVHDGARMPRDFRKVGLSLPAHQVEQLDELAAEWDEREAGRVSRSEVAREALALGLDALELVDDDPSLRRLSTRDRRALVRQAILDELREE